MIPAFVLRNIAAVNFYLYAQDFPIAQRGNAVFLGGNSSGKKYGKKERMKKPTTQDIYYKLCNR